MLKIGGIVPLSTLDFPDRLAAVLFCQGCTWRCRYCHNRHLVDPSPAAVHRWHEVRRFLERRQGVLEGVVFSGGEPTLQPALPEALAAVRAMGFLVGLHTAGPFPERLAACLSHLDWVGMDLKAPFLEYERITGVPGSGDAARASAELLRQTNVRRQWRTTLDPFLAGHGRLEALQRMVAAWGEELVVQNLVPGGPPASEPGAGAGQFDANDRVGHGSNEGRICT